MNDCNYDFCETLFTLLESAFLPRPEACRHEEPLILGHRRRLYTRYSDALGRHLTMPLIFDRWEEFFFLADEYPWYYTSSMFISTFSFGASQ